MAVNLRDRIPLATRMDAGNYESAIIYDQPSTPKPLKRFEPACDQKFLSGVLVDIRCLDFENPKMPLWYDHKLGICRLLSRFNTLYIVKRRIANYIAFTHYGSILSIFPCCYNFLTVQGQISCLVHGKCTGSTNGATGGKWSSSRSVGK